VSLQYNEYLKNHKENVAKGYYYIRDNIPSLIIGNYNYETQICKLHDMSKTNKDEYDAYDAYFYGGNKSYAVVQDFNKAWLTHIHRNPHHWQHWVLINDEPKEGDIILDMPYNYILEMICDWWAFSWSKGELYEIFKWYDEHKDYMKLSDSTRFSVEWMLMRIKESLEEQRELA
jgi:hypothetical protein